MLPSGHQTADPACKMVGRHTSTTAACCKERVTVPRCVTEVVHEMLGSLSRGKWGREDGRLKSHDTSQESEDDRKEEKDEGV